MTKLQIDDEEFDLASLNEKQRSILAHIKLIDADLAEKATFLGVLYKAREAFIQDLRNGILSQKSGFDFDEE